MNKFLLALPILAFLTTSCGQSAAPEPPTFDVPSLIGKNIDQVKAVMGAPENDKEFVWPDGTDTENSKEWDRPGNKSLLATFTKSTRKIDDFFVGCDSSTGACDDKEHLLQMGNLKEDDPRYQIEFVLGNVGPNLYNGVKAVPR